LTIARQLISDTCLSNAAYSFSTGLAEIVPVLDLPLNVTDMVVLTKSQAFLAYKLGLLLGFSTRWQDYVSEFGSVIGGGFLWRQIARQLIGLIPAWGIIPKVAISYSGTYVVGNAILGWYLTGRNLSPKQLRALSVESFTRGKEYARKLVEKLPKPRLGQGKKDRLPAPQKIPELAQGETITSTSNINPQMTTVTELASIEISNTPKQAENRSTVSGMVKRVKEGKLQRTKRQPLTWRNKKKVASLADTRICSNCGKTSSEDASFCQYCGVQFES
jgi:uncharacterized protein (DUF697 family)